MKKILFIFKTIFIIELMISFGFAEISTPTPTTALNKIASSMSHSVQNNQQICVLMLNLNLSFTG